MAFHCLFVSQYLSIIPMVPTEFLSFLSPDRNAWPESDTIDTHTQYQKTKKEILLAIV